LGPALDFIALDNPDAALRSAMAVDKAVRRLARFPGSGRMVPELEDPVIREVIHPPFRVIHQQGQTSVEVLAVLRAEQDPDFRAIGGRAPGPG
jgi:plasmid stabilization system protein ParE